MTETLKQKGADHDVVLGFRPEDVTLSNKPMPNSTEVEVYMYEPLGSEVIADLKIGEDLIKAKTAADFPLKIGEKLWLLIKEDAMHIFDKKTEQAIA
jgi:multiple sugar transport system ATP-binding protein